MVGSYEMMWTKENAHIVAFSADKGKKPVHATASLKCQMSVLNKFGLGQVENLDGLNHLMDGSKLHGCCICGHYG